MFEATTGDIVVRVEPTYLPEQSAPEEGRWAWAYRIVIENRGGIAVQLLSRRWEITDARGRTQVVEGRGVVGLQPVIPPGGSFEYASGCPLETASGIMVGHYNMLTDEGTCLVVAIPAFPLDMPNASRVLN